jgi:hypothetical protein
MTTATLTVHGDSTWTPAEIVDSMERFGEFTCERDEAAAIVAAVRRISGRNVARSTTKDPRTHRTVTTLTWKA